MNHTRLTGEAERAGQRYSLVLSALTAIYTRALQSAYPGSELVRCQAVQEAMGVATAYLNNEHPQLQNAIEVERLDALASTREDLGVDLAAGGNQASEEYAESHLSDLDTALRVQLERDIAAMVGALRNVALRAKISASARGITERAALAQLRQENTTPRYTFVDRAQRNWSSEKIVRTLVRHALVYVWNESAMLEMSERNVTQAVIDHPDESHDERGTIVSLSETSSNDVVIWEQVREDVFHPNTHAWLRPFA